YQAVSEQKTLRFLYSFWSHWTILLIRYHIQDFDPEILLHQHRLPPSAALRGQSRVRPPDGGYATKGNRVLITTGDMSSTYRSSISLKRAARDRMHWPVPRLCGRNRVLSIAIVAPGQRDPLCHSKTTSVSDGSRRGW